MLRPIFLSSPHPSVLPPFQGPLAIFQERRWKVLFFPNALFLSFKHHHPSASAFFSMFTADHKVTYRAVVPTSVSTMNLLLNLAFKPTHSKSIEKRNYIRYHVFVALEFYLEKGEGTFEDVWPVCHRPNTYSKRVLSSS